MADKTKVGNRRGCGVGLQHGAVLGNVSSCYNPRGMVDSDVQRLLELKKRYKVKLERELRLNQMQGVTFIIAKVFDELFDEVCDVEFIQKPVRVQRKTPGERKEKAGLCRKVRTRGI